MTALLFIAAISTKTDELHFSVMQFCMPRSVLSNIVRWFVRLL